MSLTITLEGSPPLALRKNRGATGQWDRMREARYLRDSSIALWWEAMGSARPVFAKCVITITQYWCGKPLDYDGLASGVAPCVDALQDVGVIEDDQPGKNIVDYRLRYERVPHMADRRWTVTVDPEYPGAPGLHSDMAVTGDRGA
jgi:hypothetical protein